MNVVFFSRISTAESNFAFFLEFHKCPDLYSAVVPRVTLEDNNDKMQQKHTTVEVARTYCHPFSSILIIPSKNPEVIAINKGFKEGRSRAMVEL